MDFFSKRKTIIFTYGLIGLWIITIFGVNHFTPENKLILFLIFATLVLVPGFSVARILNWQIDENSLGKSIYYFAIGFPLALLICLAGIIFALTLLQLTIAFFSIAIIAFLTAFLLDLRRNTSFALPTFSLKGFWRIETLYYLLVIAISSCVILILLKHGSIMTGGDIRYHLSIIQKVVGGQPLSSANLAYSKVQRDIAYVFPVWHVWLGMLSRITHVNFIAIWKDSLFMMIIPVMTVWFWLSQKIFNNKYLSVLGYTLFLSLSFYWGSGWLYTTLPIPHTLSQLLFLPLSVGLAIKFIFDEKIDYRLGITILVLILLSGVVHLTGYFYYLLIVTFFGLVYSILRFRDKNYVQTIKRFLFLIGSSLAVIVPLAVGLEIKNHLITENISAFNLESYPTAVKYSSYANYGPFSKFAYVLLPLALLVFRKNKNLIIILSIAIIAPIIYSKLLIIPATRVLGHILMDRLFGTLEWHFFVWTIIIGLILGFIDQVLTASKKLNKSIPVFVSAIFLALAGILVWAEIAGKFANSIFDIFINQEILTWLDKYYIWIIGWFCLIVALYYLGVLLKQVNFDRFSLEEPKNKLVYLLLIFMISFIAFSPNLEPLVSALRHNPLQALFEPSGESADAVMNNFAKSAGGIEEIKFINEKIPAKSVLSTNIGYFILPIVVDQHMPLYDSRAAIKNAILFDDEVPMAEKISFIHDYKIDYLLVKSDSETNGTIFDRYPSKFEKIFQGNNYIYKVK